MEYKKRDPASNSPGGIARAKALTPERRAEIAKMGGQARSKSLTQKQISKLASKAAIARWKAWRLKKKNAVDS